MLQLLCFLLPPTVAQLLSWLIEKKKQRLPYAFMRWGCFAVALYFLTAVILLPLDRAAVSIAWIGLGFEILYIHFGSSAILLSFLLAIILGAATPFVTRKLSITETSKSFIPSKRIRISAVFLHCATLILLFLTFAYIWALSNYGNIGLNEIIFHLSFSLKGTSRELIFSFLFNALLPTIIAFAFFELLNHAPAKNSYQIQSIRFPSLRLQFSPLKASFLLGILGVAGWFLFLLACADQSFQIIDFALSQLQTSELIEQEYVDPRAVQITFPEEKRNLITIYIESGETSSQDIANGGFFEKNYIPEMTRIAKENVSFSHSQKLEGATIAPNCGWTIAGLVAQSSGLPLKMAYHESWSYADSSIQGLNWFMPGATTLGDLLYENGYKNVFMAGSDFAFAGRLQYYTQHGQYEILDYNRALEQGLIPSGYYKNWGFEDQHLYSWAKEELTALSQSDQPFHFAMLTADTHMPDGYKCTLCPDTHEDPFGNILSCSSLQLNEFLAWCKAQPFYDNTSIVVTGDHASMVTQFYSKDIMDSVHGTTDRKIYNAFIGSSAEPVKEENRLFTTLDFFPTVLASIGVSIEGERLGLGTNLFSGVPTLAEEYGYETLFGELNLKSRFFDEVILQL